jgi:hypothetical protein
VHEIRRYYSLVVTKETTYRLRVRLKCSFVPELYKAVVSSSCIYIWILCRYDGVDVVCIRIADWVLVRSSYNVSFIVLGYHLLILKVIEEELPKPQGTPNLVFKVLLNIYSIDCLILQQDAMRFLRLFLFSVFTYQSTPDFLNLLDRLLETRVIWDLLLNLLQV